MFFTLLDIWLLNDVMWNVTVDPNVVLYGARDGVHVVYKNSEMVIRLW